MKNCEKLRQHILQNSLCDPGSLEIWYQPIRLASEFQMPERHVREIVSAMESDGLVRTREIGGDLVVTVTAMGSELRDSLPAGPIGF